MVHESKQILYLESIYVLHLLLYFLRGILLEKGLLSDEDMLVLLKIHLNVF